MRGVTKPVQLSCQWQDCVTTYFQLLTYRRVCNKVHTTAHIRQVARERFVRPQSLSQSSEAPRFDTPLREPALSGAEGYSYTQTATGTRRYLLTSSPANSTKGNSDFGLICRRPGYAPPATLMFRKEEIRLDRPSRNCCVRSKPAATSFRKPGSHREG
jgi:hypothetical protein